MFERHFGLRENPFHSGHQMRFLYPSREHQEARAHLRYGIENREPFVLITGEVGTGKTTALYDALAEWGSKVSVALVTNSALSREEMIEEISLRFGLPLPAGTSKPQALAQLERHLLTVRQRGEHAVLLLDEAQNLAPELLEEIRLLSNLEAQGEKLVQIFLVGQPELEAKLADPQLRQLRQRIAVHYRLNPLSPEETAGYIHHRISVAGGNPWIAFPPESCREVYRVTHGIPREINTVATQAMITAYTEGELSVRPAHVQSSTSENDFRSVLGAPANLPEGMMPMPPGGPPAPEARAAAFAAPPATPPAPPAHEPGHMMPPEPVAPTPAVVPAWAPPDLESVEPAEPARGGRVVGRATPAAEPAAPHEPAAAPASVEPVRREELDAWTRAAQELMQARRKHAGATEEPEPADEPRFPTPAELEAHAAHARPERADLSDLPARLRRKIQDDIAREDRKAHSAPLVLGLIALVAIAVAVVLAQRFQLIDVPFLRTIAGGAARTSTLAAATPAPVAPAPSPAPAESASAAVDSARVASERLHASAEPAGASAPVAGVPAATNPAPQAPAANTPAAPVAATHVPVAPKLATPVAAAVAAPRPAAARADSSAAVYTVGVASFMGSERAEQERDRLAALAKVPAQVVPYTDGGTVMYRVTLGRYPSNAAAERAASTFMAKFGVSEAQPLLLSHGKARAAD